MSDSDEDLLELNDEIDDDWVNEVEEENNIHHKQILEKDRLPDDPYIQKNANLYKALCAVDDLRFKELLGKNQIEIMKTIELVYYKPGDNIIEENEISDDMYFVIATSETADTAEIEVLKLVDNKQKFITSMGRGTYFGQKYFQTNLPAPRSATIRVSLDNSEPLLIGKVSKEHFIKWDHFRKFLVMKDVPLLRSLPREELLQMYSLLIKKIYEPNQLIIIQGDIGTEFFIILDGTVEIFDGISGKVFATLHAGHAFGETALLTDSPRMASARAIDEQCTCLSLGKDEFRAALTNDEFNKIVNDLAEKNKAIREKRDEQEKLVSQATSRATSGSSTRRSSLATDIDDGHNESLLTSFRSPRFGSMYNNNNNNNNNNINTNISSNNSNSNSSNSNNNNNNALFRSVSTPSDNNSINTADVNIFFSPVINEDLEIFHSYIPRKGYIGKYKIGKELGKGSFGSVCLCTDEGTPPSPLSPNSNEQNEHTEHNEHHEDNNNNNNNNTLPSPIGKGKTYALKTLNREVKFGSKVDVMAEIEIMKYINHINICCMKAVIDDPNHKKIYIVLEFCLKGPLMNDEMTKSGDGMDIPFTETLARKYFRDILKAVHYIHSIGIIHRDIKPQNVLKDENDICKLCDFGSAVFMHGINVNIPHINQQEVAGTPAFMAPELFKEISESTPESFKSPAVDIFALGATLYCMVIGVPPWMAKNEIDLSCRISKFELTYPAGRVIEPHLKHLINKMMEKDSLTRIDIEGVINNDWVTHEGVEPLYSIEEYENGLVPVSILSVLAAHSNRKLSSPSALLSPSPSSIPFGSSISTSINSSLPLKSSIINNNNLNISNTSNSSKMKNKINSMPTSTPVSRKISSKLTRTRSVTFQKCQEFVLFGADLAEAENDTVVDDFQILNQNNNNNNNKNKNKKLTRSTTILAEPTEIVMTTSGQTATKMNIMVVDDVEERSKRRHSRILSNDANAIKFLNNDFITDIDGDGDNNNNNNNINSINNNNNNNNNSDNNSINSNSYRSISEIEDINGTWRDVGNEISDDDDDDDDNNNNDKHNINNINNSINISYNSNLSDNGEDDDEIELAYQRSLIANINSTIKRSLLNKGKKPPKWAQNPISRTTSNSRIIHDNDHDEDILSLTSGRISANSDSCDDSNDTSDEESVGDNEILDGEEGDIDNILTDLCSPLQKKKHFIDTDCLPIICNTELNSKTTTITPIIIKDKLSKLHTTSLNTNLNLGIRYHQAQCIGCRPYMEDRIYANGDLSVFVNIEGSTTIENKNSYSNNSDTVPTTSIGFFGVYDGHNGDYVAEILQSTLAIEFQKNVCSSNLMVNLPITSILNNNTNLPISNNSSFCKPNTSEIISNCLIDAIATLERQIVEIDIERQKKILKSNRDLNSGGLVDTLSFAGSVAVMMTIYPISFSNNNNNKSNNNNNNNNIPKYQIAMAHVGDCRAVLCDNGNTVNLTKDHKPDDEKEKKRIEIAGGFVHKSRVNGVLAVSRSFGDIMYKTYVPSNIMSSPEITIRKNSKLRSSIREEQPPHGLWCTTQQVIAKPDITVFDILPQHEFIIMACDGLWDVFSNEEAVNFVRKLLFENGNIQFVAQELIAKALERGSGDNISVLIICLNQQEIIKLN